METKLSIGLLGLGTVGTGVLQMIKEQNEAIYQKTGIRLSVVKVLVAPHEDLMEVSKRKKVTCTNSLAEIVNDPEIDVIVELIGGIHPAREFISQSLQHHKHVVTANKDLLARYGTELVALAQKEQVGLFYEASVAGGIPILRTLSTHYLADQITRACGILNGTTNFMLTKMADDNMPYRTALKCAQESGFAEADPKNDVEGFDTAYKMVILAKFAFGMTIDLADIKIMGINELPYEEVLRAKELGYEVKLIGEIRKVGDTIAVSVGPTLVPQDHPLAMIKNEMNGIFIQSQNLGETMFYGPGAGSLPTATSVLADLLSIAENKQSNTRLPRFSAFDKERKIAAVEEICATYYVSIGLKDQTVLENLFKQRTDLTFSEVEIGVAHSSFIVNGLSEASWPLFLEKLQKAGDLNQRLRILEVRNEN